MPSPRTPRTGTASPAIGKSPNKPHSQHHRSASSHEGPSSVQAVIVPTLKLPKTHRPASILAPSTFDRSRGVSVFDSFAHHNNSSMFSNLHNNNSECGNGNGEMVINEDTAREVRRRQLEAFEVLQRLYELQQQRYTIYGWRDAMGQSVVDKMALVRAGINAGKKRIASRNNLRHQNAEDEEDEEYEEDLSDDEESPLLLSRLSLVNPCATSAGWVVAPVHRGGCDSQGCPSTSHSDANAFSETQLIALRGIQSNVELEKEWRSRKLSKIRALLYRSAQTTIPSQPLPLVLPTKLQRPLHIVDSSSFGGGNGGAAIVWISPVLKQNKQGKLQQRLLFMTRTHLYSCLLNEGNIQRCVSLDLISHVHVHVPQQCRFQANNASGGVRNPVGDLPASVGTPWAKAAINAVPSQMLDPFVSATTEAASITSHNRSATSNVTTTTRKKFHTYSEETLTRYAWGGYDTGTITSQTATTIMNASCPTAWMAINAEAGGGGPTSPKRGGVASAAGGLGVPDSSDVSDYPCEIIILVPNEYDFYFYLKECSYSHFITALRECHFAVQWKAEKLQESKEVHDLVALEHKRIEAECAKYVAFASLNSGAVDDTPRSTLQSTNSVFDAAAGKSVGSNHPLTSNASLGLMSPMFLGGADATKFQLDNSSTWTVTSPPDVNVPGIPGKPPSEQYAAWESRILSLCDKPSKLFEAGNWNQCKLAPKLRVSEYPTSLSKVPALVKSIRLEKPPTFIRKSVAPLTVPHTRLLAPLRPKRQHPPPPPPFTAEDPAGTDDAAQDTFDSLSFAGGEHHIGDDYNEDDPRNSRSRGGGDGNLYNMGSSSMEDDLIAPFKSLTASKSGTNVGADFEDYNDDELVGYLASAVRAEERREQRQRDKWLLQQKVLQSQEQKRSVAAPLPFTSIGDGSGGGFTVSSPMTILPPAAAAVIHIDAAVPTNISNITNVAPVITEHRRSVLGAPPLPHPQSPNQLSSEQVDRSLQVLLNSYDTRRGCLQERIAILRDEVNRLTNDNANLIWLLPRDQQRSFCGALLMERQQQALLDKEEAAASAATNPSTLLSYYHNDPHSRLLASLEGRDDELRRILKNLDTEASRLWDSNVRLTIVLGRGEGKQQHQHS